MSKCTKAARGQPCQVRIPGICNHNPETTVFAHLGGGGMGAKKADVFGAFACSDCHDVLDRRTRSNYKPDILKLWHYEGMERTQQILLDMGLIHYD